MPHLLLKEFEKGSKNSLIKKRIITHYIQNGCSTITEPVQRIGFECAYCYEIYR